MNHKALVKVAEGKVQFLGSGFYVHIPAVWRRQFDVRKGDVLYIYSTDTGELILKPPDNGRRSRS